MKVIARLNIPKIKVRTGHNLAVVTSSPEPEPEPEPEFDALEYLTDSGRAFWDFTAIPVTTTDDESLITQVTGIGTSGLNLVSAAGRYPRKTTIQTGYDLKSAYKCHANSSRKWVLVTSAAPNSVLNSSFEIVWLQAWEDFRIANQVSFGVQDAAFNNGIKLLNHNGVISLQYAAGGNSFTWTSSAAVLPDGPIGETLLGIKADFDANTFELWVNGAPITGSVTAGTIASVDPSSFTVGSNLLCIGAHNSNGTISSDNLTFQYFTKFSITPIMTGEEFAGVVQFLLSTEASNATVTVDENYAITPFSDIRLKHWFDGDDDTAYNLVGGGFPLNINSIKDKSGMFGLLMTASGSSGNKPLKVLGGQNGRSLVRGTTASAGLLGTRITEIQGLSKFTMFFVGGRDTQWSQGLSANATRRITFVRNSAGVVNVVVANTASTFAAFNDSDAGVKLFTIVFDGTQTHADPTTQNNLRLKVFVNNVAQALTFTGNIPATTESQATSFPGLAVSPFDTTIRFAGDHYEVDFRADVAMNTTEATAQYTYYYNPKYAFT